MQTCNCGSVEIKWVEHYETKWGIVSISKCQKCGLVRDLIDHDYDSFYSDSAGIYQPPNESEFQSQVVGMGRYVSFLEECVHEKGKVLDIGCNAGYLVKALSDANWQSSGVEIVPSVAKFAVSRGLKVFNCNLAEIPSEESVFDVITVTHVLEHVPKLQEFLKEIGNHLNPNGYLFIAVPNFSKINKFIYGKSYDIFIPGQHIWYFENKTLANIVEQSGFKLIQQRTLYSTNIESKKMFGSFLKRLLSYVVKITGDGEELLAVFQKKG